jgi:hypothetical protein
VEELAAGSLVKHRTLGAGKVVAVEATALHVFFPATGTRFAAKLRWPAASPFLALGALDPDPWLEGLTSFALDSTSGRYALAANFLSQDEAVAAFLAENPDAFREAAPSRKPAPGSDRSARWRAACAEWTAAFGGDQAERLLEDGRVAEMSRRALRVAARAAAVPGMVDAEVLQEALAPGEEVGRFFEALFAYVAVPSPARARFEKLLASTHALGLPPEAAWPVVTFFPFVAAPARHVVLLPRSTCAGASRLGCDLQCKPAPSWATYTRLRDLSARLLAKLGPSGARDLVDVEGFLHATGARRPVKPGRSPDPGAVRSRSKGAPAAPRRKR